MSAAKLLERARRPRKPLPSREAIQRRYDRLRAKATPTQPPR